MLRRRICCFDVFSVLGWLPFFNGLIDILIRVYNKFTEWLRTSKDRKNIEDNKSPVSTAFRPYIQGITEPTGRLLNKHNIKIIFKAPMNVGQMLKDPKDKRSPLNTPSLSKIPRSCGKVNVGKTVRTICQRVKKYKSSVRLHHFTNANPSDCKYIHIVTETKGATPNRSDKLSCRPTNENTPTLLLLVAQWENTTTLLVKK